MHQDATSSSSPFSHGNCFIDEQGEPLYRLSFGNFFGYPGAGAETSRSSVSASLRTGEVPTTLAARIAASTYRSDMVPGSAIPGGGWYGHTAGVSLRAVRHRV
ncbi:hypothetical protein, partial [Streptomyces griseorubens]|uniref:hypothetical protein n=1 Tax=Streptomyces griseorubens TaxID=66897 RepID=UPI003516AF63